MKKKVLALVLTAAMAAAALSGCGAKEGYTIGISQFADHGSLDNCREGFLAGLAEEGIKEGENLTIEYVNAQADPGTAGMTASNFVTKKVDMICAIATPSATTAYNATMNSDIPVIYTAVTDPVGAGLANADGSPVGNVTGTSDVLAVDAQLQMIRLILPEAKTIGIIYTTSETNSVSAIAQYKAVAGEYGFEIVDSGVTAMSEVALAAADICGKVDCITNLTDNTVVSALQTVLEEANKAGIPVFGSEVEQVKNGCVASMGLEYIELGKQTGRMAAKVLKGEAKASEMNFEVISEPSLYVNFAAAKKLDLELPASYAEDAYQSFDEIIVE
ncbi:MAG: ABC transporter substrate-binding protein [Butyrivibrio sp.]|nr:ABC transporter substrate-binding protein [Muribaculum sp.]MCM1553716.1 ABC transporter substrate-binding protein [Butyrivibrio sp.]